MSYRFTGEDPNELNETMKKICSALEERGHSASCTFWKEEHFRKNRFTNKQILEHALKEIDDSDVYFAFVKSQDKSEGMLIEAGYAIARDKRFILAIKRGIKTTFMREIADEVIDFEDVNDLVNKLRDYEIQR